MFDMFAWEKTLINKSCSSIRRSSGSKVSRSILLDYKFSILSFQGERGPRGHDGPAGAPGARVRPERGFSKLTSSSTWVREYNIPGAEQVEGDGRVWSEGETLDQDRKAFICLQKQAARQDFIFHRSKFRQFEWRGCCRVSLSSYVGFLWTLSSSHLLSVCPE